MEKFKKGQLLLTAGVRNLIDEDDSFSCFVADCFINRYCECDWGEMCEEDKALNDEALKSGGRIFAAYEKEGLPKIYIITEWNRSATTILFPDEY